MHRTTKDHYKLKLLKDMLEKVDSNLLQMELCTEVLKVNGELHTIADKMTTENDFNRKFQLMLKVQIEKQIAIIEGGVVNSITHKQSIV